MEEQGTNNITIHVKKLGLSRPVDLQIPSNIKLSDLQKLIGTEIRLPVERLKPFFQGVLLENRKRQPELYVKFNDGDSVLAVVAPKTPAKYLQGDNDDDEEEMHFHLSETSPLWLQKFATFLQERLGIPDMLLIAIFSIRLKTWVMIFLWFFMAPIAHKYHLGPVYILVTAFSLIFMNLGERGEGDSAYSIFNEGFRELPGTLNADRLDRDIRAGQF